MLNILLPLLFYPGPKGPKIPKFNFLAAQRLDVDLLEVEDFATCLSVSSGNNLQAEFATLRGIVKLLLTNEARSLLFLLLLLLLLSSVPGLQVP